MVEKDFLTSASRDGGKGQQELFNEPSSEKYNAAEAPTTTRWLGGKCGAFHSHVNEIRYNTMGKTG